MKKILLTLLAILVVISLAAGTGYGLAWYESNHVTIGGHSYYLYEESLDLTERDLSIAEYEQLKAVLPGCDITWMVPFQGGAFTNKSTSLSISTFTQADSDLVMKYFPGLKSLDASRCKDYAVLQAFQAAKPNCTVSYTVDLGGKAANLNDVALTLENGDYELETLTENLQYLPKLAEMTLRVPEMTLEQIDGLKAAYPDISIHCTVDILGQEYDNETETLDLSALEPADVEAVAQKLAMLPKLTSVELMAADGTSKLAAADAKKLVNLAPNAAFHYEFDFFGQKLSSDMEEVVFTKVKMGDAAETELRTALDLLPKCKRFVLDTCGFSSEVLAKVREDYREQTKIVWRISFSKRGSCLTDAEIFRSIGSLYDNYKEVQYCEDVVYMDIGHNEYLKDISFTAKMPKLKALVASGSSISDLSPLANCKELEFLELTFCGYVEDLSPLKELTSLRMLNIGNTKVTDLSALDNLQLSHLGARRNGWGKSLVPNEEQDRFEKLHPGCWAEWDGDQPYGTGWRYEEDNLTFNPYYHKLRMVFRYDLAPNDPKQTGMYIGDIDGYLKDKLKENKTFADYEQAAEDAWAEFKEEAEAAAKAAAEAAKPAAAEDEATTGTVQTAAIDGQAIPAETTAETAPTETTGG